MSNTNCGKSPWVGGFPMLISFHSPSNNDNRNNGITCKKHNNAHNDNQYYD